MLGFRIVIPVAVAVVQFMIRAAGLAFLCGPDSGEANITFDCYDAEQTASNLVVSEVIVEVNPDFSE